MIETFSEYIRLQPNAEDASEIKQFIKKVEANRPPKNVKVWAMTTEENLKEVLKQRDK